MEDRWFEDWETETPEALALRLDALEAPWTRPLARVESDVPATIERAKLDPTTSLRLMRDQAELERYFADHRNAYGDIRTLMRAIDHVGAWALEERLVEERRTARENAIAMLKAAPKYPGVRRDGPLLKQMFEVKGRALSRRMKQVFALCIEQELSINQCANILGINRETVRSHLRKLRSEVPAAWRVPRTA